jgi:polysaccharide biosynthesis protein PslG
MQFRTKSLFSAVLASALAAGALAAPSAMAQKDFMGIAADDVFQQTGSYRSTNLAGIRRAHVGLIRQVFNWSQTKESPGDYTIQYHDQYVADVAIHGLSVMPVLTHAPEFYKLPGSKRGANRPTDLAQMAAWAQVLVRRYGPNGTLWSDNPGLRKVPIRVWQIWNEPSLDVYWGPRPNAREYAEMLRVVGRAIKEVDPGAEIVAAGLPPSKLAGAVQLDRYLKQLYSAGAKAHFDTLAINAYAKDAKELEKLLVSVRKLMKSRRDSAKIWVTELGWGDKGLRHRFIVGRKGQAERIKTSFEAVRKLRRKLRLRGLVYFSWRDSKPYAPLFQNLWGLHTGLLDLQGRRKPAYKAFVRGAKKL